MLTLQKKRRMILMLILSMSVILVSVLISLLLFDNSKVFHNYYFVIIGLIILCHVLAYHKISQYISIANKFEKQSALLLNSFEAMDDVFFFVIDKNYNYLAISEPDIKFMEKYFNVSPEIGKNVKDFLSGETLELFYENIEVAKHSNKHVTTDHFLIDGQDVYILNSYYALRDKNDEVYAISCVTMNVSDEINERQNYVDLVYRDSLTSVYNRRKTLQYYHEVIQANNIPTWIVLIDLNNFKQLNDTHGHIMGDRLLTELSWILTDEFPAKAIVSRMGGDEFCILVSEMKEAELELIIKNVRKKARTLPFYPLSLAIGYCLVSEPEKHSFATYYDQADALMFENKFAHKRNKQLIEGEKI